MIKKIALALGSFLVLLGAVWVYSWLAGRDITGQQSSLQNLPQISEQTGEIGGVEISDIMGPRVRGVDPETGRLEAIYSAERARKLEGRFLLFEPEVELFPEDGQAVTITAEEGTIWADELAGNPRRAELRGNVRIVVDRRVLRGPDTPLLAQRPDDRLLIVTDEMTFDNTELELRAPGRIEVYSAEADIIGHDLTITWNTHPRELRMLKLARGERMVIRQGADAFDIRVAAAAEPTTQANPATSPASAPATLPAATAPTPPGQPEAPAGRLYRIALNENVRVTQGDQQLRGADLLELLFEMDRDMVDSRREPADEPSPPSAPAVPASAPTGDRAEADPPLVVEWAGELMIQPAELAAGQREFDVRAEGEHLVLGDQAVQAHCVEMTYLAESRRGRLLGRDDRPVRIVTAEGEQLICRAVRIERNEGRAYLEGAGWMLIEADSQLASTGAESSADASIRVPPSSAPPSMNATAWTVSPPFDQPSNEAVLLVWGDGAEVEFAPGEGDDAEQAVLRRADFFGRTRVVQQGVGLLRAETISARFAADDGRSRLDQFEATGEVSLTNQETGDRVESDRLTAAMTELPDGGLYPQQVQATGDVSAVQGEYDIDAGEILLGFRPSTEAELAKDDQPFQPDWFRATGGVDITGRDGEQDVRITGESMEMSDVASGEAIIFGREDAPAEMVRDDARILGREIHISEAQQYLTVESEGELTFVSTNDLAGIESDEARPVDVDWTDRMSFRLSDMEILFLGQVELVSGQDQLTCNEQLRLTLVEAEVDPNNASATQPTTTSTPAGDEEHREALQQRLARLELSQMTATGDVRLISQLHDDQQYLLRRLRVFTPELTYDVPEGVIDADQGGTLVIEDYRPPEPGQRDGEGRPMLQDNLTRPSQTAVRWGDSMRLLMHDDQPSQVTFDGGVRLGHRSGDLVQPPADARIRPMEQLQAGRYIWLNSEDMIARFGDDADDSAVQQGPRVGSLRMFAANGAPVEVGDDTRRVTGRRVVYDRELDVAQIFGNAPGETGGQAFATDPQYGLVGADSWIWRMSEGRLIMQNVRATGGR